MNTRLLFLSCVIALCGPAALLACDDADGAGQVSSSCDMTTDFTACGGNLVGSWEFTLACATVPNDSIANLKAVCPEAEFSLAVDLTGEVEFKSDKTYRSMQDVTLVSSFSLPRSCLEDRECAELDATAEWTEVAGVCERTSTESQMNDEAGTYATEDGTLTLTEAGGVEEGTAEYCVKGDRATLSVTTEGLTLVYHIERK